MKSDRRPLPSLPADLRRRGTLPDDVAAYIRQLVLTGVLKPGQKIDQESVGEVLCVSLSQIREAIVILGQEGLLDVTPRRGASVALLTADDIIDHYELFGTVSGRAAAMAASVLTEAQLGELRSIQHAFRMAPANTPPAELSKMNDGFHRIVNACAPRRTRWLLRLLERSVPADYYEFANGWNARAVDHHQSILDAIVARDADGARRAMEHHLHESGVAAADALRAQGFWE
jgi:DNA-binding GntR family transcriptional regulator